MKSKVNALKSLILTGIIIFSSVATFAVNDETNAECCNFASVNVATLIPMVPVVADFEDVSSVNVVSVSDIAPVTPVEADFNDVAIDEMILFDGLAPESTQEATFDDEVIDSVNIAGIAPVTPIFADFE